MIEPMPPTVDRRPFISITGPIEGMVEGDRDWSDENFEAVTWLADNHQAIREALTVSDERVERAAIALFQYDYPQDKWSKFGQKDYHPERYRAKARAALTASS